MAGKRSTDDDLFDLKEVLQDLRGERLRSLAPMAA